MNRSDSGSMMNRAHVKIARNIHPDRMGDHNKDPEVLQAIQMVNNAADILKDPVMRDIYNNARSPQDFAAKMADHQKRQAEERQDKAAQEAAAAARAHAERAAKEAAENKAADAAAAANDTPWYQRSARNEQTRAYRRTEFSKNRPTRQSTEDARTRFRAKIEKQAREAKAREQQKARKFGQQPKMPTGAKSTGPYRTGVTSYSGKRAEERASELRRERNAPAETARDGRARRREAQAAASKSKTQDEIMKSRSAPEVPAAAASS